jgi:hypothetical protein
MYDTSASYVYSDGGSDLPASPRTIKESGGVPPLHVGECARPHLPAISDTCPIPPHRRIKPNTTCSTNEGSQHQPNNTASIVPTRRPGSTAELPQLNMEKNICKTSYRSIHRRSDHILFICPIDTAYTRYHDIRLPLAELESSPGHVFMGTTTPTPGTFRTSSRTGTTSP